jgi:hypothetical protein
LVIQRWRDQQLSLYEPNGYGYHVIATNRDELTAEELVWFHNERGQIENDQGAEDRVRDGADDERGFSS